ncbi:MAG: sigma-70 family RNA polymerase sigma factor [Planctomycetia bacterium]|nr:sigma-70 family RNA polymerase sigma factor [Planctomycetia bacterium]
MSGDSVFPIDSSRRNERTEEFIRLFTRHEPRIFAYILTLLPSFPDAEDALQQTNLVMWRKFGEFQTGTDFMSWGRRIAHLEVLALRKRKQRTTTLFSDEFVEAVATENEAQSDALESRQRALAVCLAKLKPRDQHLVHLRYQPGATTQSVAQQVGRSADAVYKALNRIREALWGCIKRTLSVEAHA